MAIDKINFKYPRNSIQSIYSAEEMTALELAAATAGKVDECVDKTNESTSNVANIRTELTAFEANVTNVLVPQEVSEKIEALVDDGTIGRIVNTELLGQINTDIDTLQTDVTSLTTTVNNNYNTLNTKIINDVNGLKTYTDTQFDNVAADIATEVATLNSRITTEVADIGNDITSAVSTLNTTISTNVATINSRIDTEVDNLEADITDVIRNENIIKASRADTMLFNGVNSGVAGDTAKLLVIGDSNTRGAGLDDSKKESFVNVLRSSLSNAYGITPTEGYNFNLFEDLTVTKTGTYSEVGNGICGKAISLSVGATLSFSIKASFLRILHTQQGGGGSYHVTFNGVNKTAVSTAGTLVYSQYNANGECYGDLSEDPQNMDIIITCDSGTVIIEGYLATGKIPNQGFIVSQLGVDGDSYKKLNNATRLASLTRVLNFEKTGIVLLTNGANDIFGSDRNTPSEFNTNIRAIIASIKAARTDTYKPQIILTCPTLTSSTSIYVPLNGYTYNDYREIIYTIAKDENLPVIDFSVGMKGAYGSDNIDYLFQADGLHINKGCNLLIGKLILDTIFPSIPFNIITNEDGVYKPTLYGSTTPGTNTYSSQIGRFKVRNGLCFVQFEVFLTAKDAAMAGSLRITLPKTAKAAPRSGISIGSYDGVTFSGSNTQLTGYVEQNASYISIMQNGASISALAATQIGNGFMITGCVSYAI